MCSKNLVDRPVTRLLVATREKRLCKCGISFPFTPAFLGTEYRQKLQRNKHFDDDTYISYLRSKLLFWNPVPLREHREQGEWMIGLPALSLIHI